MAALAFSDPSFCEKSGRNGQGIFGVCDGAERICRRHVGGGEKVDPVSGAGFT